jgi:hypothetical protein
MHKLKFEVKSAVMGSPFVSLLQNMVKVGSSSAISFTVLVSPCQAFPSPSLHFYQSELDPWTGTFTYFARYTLFR